MFNKDKIESLEKEIHNLRLELVNIRCTMITAGIAEVEDYPRLKSTNAVYELQETNELLLEHLSLQKVTEPSLVKLKTITKG